MAFTGTFEHNLDAKNRLTIPSKFRAELSKGVYLSRAMDNCISLYPSETYTQMAEQALSQVRNPLSQQGRELRRLLYGNALETELDSAGRVMLTQRFLEHAARAGPKIQLVVALLLVPSVLLLVAAALVASLWR